MDATPTLRLESENAEWKHVPQECRLPSDVCMQRPGLL